MGENNFILKTIRLVSLSVFAVFVITYSAFAMSDNRKNSSEIDSSSISCSEDNNGNESINSKDNISIADSEIYFSSQQESNLFFSDSISTQATSQYNNSSTVQEDSQNDISYKSIEYSSNDNFSNIKVSSKYSSSSDLQSSSNSYCSNNANSKCKDCQGFIWMDIERMRSEIDTVSLNRFYDEINSGTHSVPNYVFDSNKFYDIIKIIKKYNWTEHKSYINSYQIEACEITVIGNDRVYTYLVFGRDESGRGFVWSFYDYKIAYLSEQDFSYIENIFLTVA